MLQHTTFYCLMEFSGEEDNSLVPNNSCFSDPCPGMISLRDAACVHSILMTICKSVCGPHHLNLACERSKLSYSVLTAQMLPGSQALFSSGCLLQEKLKKKKNHFFIEHTLIISSQRTFFSTWFWTEKSPRVAKGLTRKHLGLSSHIRPYDPIF